MRRRRRRSRSWSRPPMAAGCAPPIWTAVALEELEGRHPGFNEKLFAIASVSGGSVGALFWHAALRRFPGESQHAERALRIDRGLGRDFLASVIGGIVVADAPQRFIPDLNARFAAGAGGELADRHKLMEATWLRSAAERVRAIAASSRIRRHTSVDQASGGSRAALAREGLSARSRMPGVRNLTDEGLVLGRRNPAANGVRSDVDQGGQSPLTEDRQAEFDKSRLEDNPPAADASRPRAEGDGPGRVRRIGLDRRARHRRPGPFPVSRRSRPRPAARGSEEAAEPGARVSVHLMTDAEASLMGAAAPTLAEGPGPSIEIVVFFWRRASAEITDRGPRGLVGRHRRS